MMASSTTNAAILLPSVAASSRLAAPMANDADATTAVACCWRRRRQPTPSPATTTALVCLVCGERVAQNHYGSVCCRYAENGRGKISPRFFSITVIDFLWRRAVNSSPPI